MNQANFGKSRPLWQVILFSVSSFLLYYGWYKWIIHEELRKYNGQGWSGNKVLLPFIFGVIFPQILWISDRDVGSWFGWFSLIGVVWIYISQFKLYRTLNELYRTEGRPEPIVIWWLFVPGLNLIAGLRQIHFLSEYWARKQNRASKDPVVETIPFLFANN